MPTVSRLPTGVCFLIEPQSESKSTTCVCLSLSDTHTHTLSNSCSCALGDKEYFDKNNKKNNALRKHQTKSRVKLSRQQQMACKQQQLTNKQTNKKKLITARALYRLTVVCCSFPLAHFAFLVALLFVFDSSCLVFIFLSVYVGFANMKLKAGTSQVSHFVFSSVSHRIWHLFRLFLGRIPRCAFIYNNYHEIQRNK